MLHFSDGYTISDVVMYWRDEPVVGVEVFFYNEIFLEGVYVQEA